MSSVKVDHEWFAAAEGLQDVAAPVIRGVDAVVREGGAEDLGGVVEGPVVGFVMDAADGVFDFPADVVEHVGECAGVDGGQGRDPVRMGVDPSDRRVGGTVSRAADVRGVFARAWPSLRIPVGAVDAWVELQLGLGLLDGPPACATGPERWWATAATAGGSAAQAEAVAWCVGCPVRVECAAYAIAAAERFGIWGGTTPAERRSS
jgi:WhiB family transcriptional regulator, redox-sensing transcriptional regulator